MRTVVLDTNVVVAGLRSRRGASFRVLSLIGGESFRTVMSVALLFEYEDVLKRPGTAIPLSSRAIDDVLDYLCQVSAHLPIHFLWRPTLRDPRDDLVLEIAVAGGCENIVTHNIRDFSGSEKFGVRPITPGRLLRELGLNKEKP